MAKKSFILKDGDYIDGTITDWLERHIKLKARFFTPREIVGNYRVKVEVEKI